MRPSIPGVLRFLGVAALAALSLPGVHAARAEADLVPPVKRLFAFDASAPARAPAQASCGSDPGRALQAAQARRQAALARIAEHMAGGSGGAVALNGRGYGYPVQRDPSLELARIQEEARRLRAAEDPH